MSCLKGNFCEPPQRRHSGKGNQSKHEDKKAGRLYEAEKFQSLTNICRIRVPGNFLFVRFTNLKISWLTSRSIGGFGTYGICIPMCTERTLHTKLVYPSETVTQVCLPEGTAKQFSVAQSYDQFYVCERRSFTCNTELDKLYKNTAINCYKLLFLLKKKNGFKVGRYSIFY